MLVLRLQRESWKSGRIAYIDVLLITMREVFIIIIIAEENMEKIGMDQ